MAQQNSKRPLKKGKEARFSLMLFRTAVAIARKAGAKALFVYGDIPLSFDGVKVDKSSFKVILVSSRREVVARAPRLFDHSIQLPDIPMDRMGQIKMSVVMAVSGKMIKPRNRIVFLAGTPKLGVLDSIVVIDVAKEFSLLASPQMLDFASEVDHTIFDQLVCLAVELGNEGREGAPVGTIFVLGDTREVLKHVEQMIINPFKGHVEKNRQILNPEVQEGMKELSQLDGAFIIRPNGVIETAGAYIAAKLVPEALPQGLGARHYSAAAITAATKAIAITISQSTGDVHIFKDGQIVTCIEKFSR
jgi:DNA integrity scanning protein DisA with diadenylate cyclase activity